MDFTDDPFRDYRYEDPFNIAFDDEPADTSDAFDSSSTKSDTKGDPKFDPFGLGSVFNSTDVNKYVKIDIPGVDGRQSVPLPVSDPFVKSSGRISVPPSWKDISSEDQQLAWAAKESLKLEEVRKQRQIQEEAELELAISLSKSESQKR